jgi:hypothetical protein
MIGFGWKSQQEKNTLAYFAHLWATKKKKVFVTLASVEAFSSKFEQLRKAKWQFQLPGVNGIRSFWRNLRRYLRKYLGVCNKLRWQNKSLPGTNAINFFTAVIYEFL